MAVNLLSGPVDWKKTRDDVGHEEYSVTFKVECDLTDGPYLAGRAAGLPQPGDIWDFGGGETYAQATCTAREQVNPIDNAGNNTMFLVTKVFSTKPRCLIVDPDDVLAQPPKVTVEFVKFQEEAVRDRFGEPIKSSSHEQLRGPQVEFDANRPQVTIEQNVLNASLPLLSLMMDTVNDSPLWGYPARAVKMSSCTLEELYLGRCVKYYRRRLVFDIRYRCIDGVSEAAVGTDSTGTGTSLEGDCLGGYETFDRELLDEGTKVLKGHWGRGMVRLPPAQGGIMFDEGHGWVVDDISPSYTDQNLQIVPAKEADPDNPSHFIRFKDRNNENARVILNGAGLPWDPSAETSGTADDEPGRIRVEKYGESNFLLLGIPAAIG